MQKLVICFCFLTLFALDAQAQTVRRSPGCGGISVPPVSINVAKDLGKVIYDHSKSRREIEEIAGKNLTALNNAHTAGLTVANMRIDGNTEIRRESVPGGYCVYLSEVNVQFFYDDLMVYIDRRYPRGSCEYNAIVAHEQKHISIARMVIDFYTPYVKLQIEKITYGLEPQFLNTAAKLDKPPPATTNKYYKDLITKELQPILDLIKEQLEKGNALQDTPEAYLKDSQKCYNW